MPRLFAFLFCLLLAPRTFAQWQPEVLWDQSGSGDSSRFGYRILALGDQNVDGYADFGVWSFGAGGPTLDDSGKVELFHGGNPPSTTPYHTFRLDSSIRAIYDAKVLGDVNGDGYQDPVVVVRFHFDTLAYHALIYWGGPAFDGQVDLVSATR